MLVSNAHLTEGALSDDDGMEIDIFTDEYAFDFTNGDGLQSESVQIKVISGEMERPIATASYAVSKDEILLGINETYVHESFRGRGIATQLMLLRAELGIKRWRELNGFDENELPGKISVLAGDEDSADAIMAWLSDYLCITQAVGKSRVESCDARCESKNRVIESWIVTMYKRAVESVSVLANSLISEQDLQEIYEVIYSGNGNIDQ